MRRNRAFLALQAAVCVLLAAMLCASAVGIYREGTLRKAKNPLESVYTPEIVAERFAAVAPLFFASVGLLIAGLLLGARDANAEKWAKGSKIPRKPAAEQPSEGMRGKRGAVQAILVAVAVALILIGALNGSARDVFYKAITICTECVGLG